MDDNVNIDSNKPSKSFFGSLISKIPHILFVFLLIFGIRYCSNQINYMENFKTEYISNCDGSNKLLNQTMVNQIQEAQNLLDDPSTWTDYCECAFNNLITKYPEEKLKRIDKKISGDVTQSDLIEYYGEVTFSNYENKINELLGNDPEVKEFINYSNNVVGQSCIYILE